MKTGKKVAVIGSGPAGLAAAQQLARAGHDVHVYEKNARPGGLLVYGIPDFKMEKDIIARRATQMEAEGVTFHCNVTVGKDVSAKALQESHDAVLFAMGSEHPFDFFAKSPGRDLDGIHYAMDFLAQQNRRVARRSAASGHEGDLGQGQARHRHRRRRYGIGLHRHVVPSGRQIGDAARDHAEAAGAREQGAVVAQLAAEAAGSPRRQAEGAAVEYSVSTTGFSGEGGKVKKLHYTQVDSKLQPVPGSDAALDAELVLFAMGFSGPTEGGAVGDLGLEIVPRGRFKGLDANERDYKVPGAAKVFAAGDVRRGQSLVVWAIREGRQAAHAIDKFLMGKTTLPR